MLHETTMLLGSSLATSSLEWHLSALHPSHLTATLYFYPHFSDKEPKAARLTNLRKKHVGRLGTDQFLTTNLLL